MQMIWYVVLKLMSQELLPPYVFHWIWQFHISKLSLTHILCTDLWTSCFRPDLSQIYSQSLMYTDTPTAIVIRLTSALWVWADESSTSFSVSMKSCLPASSISKPRSLALLMAQVLSLFFLWPMKSSAAAAVETQIISISDFLFIWSHRYWRNWTGH